MSSSSSPSSEEAAVKEYLTEFSQKWLAASVTKDPAEFESVMLSMGFDEDCLFIRPSGNPATMDTFKAMVADGDILVKKQEIVEFTSFRLIADGKVAIVTYWEESEFSYKGIENNDRAKLTAVLEKTEEGKWKPIHWHRGSG